MWIAELNREGSKPSDIIDYNEKVINGKYYLSNPWTSWYIELAYKDAKIIEINNNPMIQH